MFLKNAKTWKRKLKTANNKNKNVLVYIKTTSSAMAEGPRDA